METPHFRAYLREAERFLRQAAEQASAAISDAADLIARAIAEGRVLYVFGPSHAGLLAQDLFYRAGGLVAIEPILPAGLMLNERPITRTTHLERLPGYAETILRDVPLGTGDVLLVISVSGRNAVAVEICTGAQARGARVIALTSLAYSRSVAPRGAARLFEVADVVIDTCTPPGDAAVQVPDLDTPVGPLTTIACATIINMIKCEVAAQLTAAGKPPSVLTSSVLVGRERSDELFEASYDEFRTRTRRL